MEWQSTRQNTLSHGLKILVSVVRFRPEPPYAHSMQDEIFRCSPDAFYYSNIFHTAVAERDDMGKSRKPFVP